MLGIRCKCSRSPVGPGWMPSYIKSWPTALYGSGVALRQALESPTRYGSAQKVIPVELQASTLRRRQATGERVEVPLGPFRSLKRRLRQQIKHHVAKPTT